METQLSDTPTTYRTFMTTDGREFGAVHTRRGGRWKLSSESPDRRLHSYHGDVFVTSGNNIQDTVRYNRLRWYSHLQRMDRDKWPKRILTLDVEGPNPCGRPRRKWCSNIREDLHHLNLDKINPQDRDKWRAAIKPRLYCASTSNPWKTGNNRR
ncbi:hypothetical protein Bbelb_097270 [Branchiostoma belcheri]|nr:hypothetical protein Bbelb_097270 [Branchiostoma belcheri]